jgi:hypothetical protein
MELQLPEVFLPNSQFPLSQMWCLNSVPYAASIPCQAAPLPVLSYNCAVAEKKPEKRQFHVGDPVRVNLHTGRIVDATIKAVIERIDGVRLQVDFGHDETALIHEWQV